MRLYPHATSKPLAYLGVQPCVNRETAGSIAGFLATVPMTIAMNAMHRALPEKDQHPLPPRHIAENAAAAAGVDLGASEDTHEAATLAAHFGYGAAAGSIYAPFAGSTGLPRAAEGALYGVGVWGASYLGLLPGAGLYPAATEESPARNGLMISAHLIWGASLGLLMGLLEPKA